MKAYQSPKAKNFFVIEEIPEDDCVVAAYSTLRGAIAGRKKYARQGAFPDNTRLAITKLFGGVVKEPETIAILRRTK